MSVTTTLKCDKCGDKWDPELHKYEYGPDQKQLWTVGVVMHCYPKRMPAANIAQTNKVVAEWCRPCAVEMGLLGPNLTPKAEDPPAPPTFEDLIRELVDDAVADAVE